MNIKRIIQEEIDDLQWMTDIEPDIFKILDTHFKIETEVYGNSSLARIGRIELIKVEFITDENPLKTYRDIRGVSTKKLYSILTNMPKYKLLFNRGYKDMKKKLSQWHKSRSIGVMVSDEVQHEVSIQPQRGTGDTGPR